VGDTVQLMDGDHNEFSVTISDICQNFVFSYIFFNAETCEAKWKTPEYQTIYMNVAADVDSHELSADLMSMDEVANVTINQDVEDRFNNMMKSMDFIVVVIIFSAAALAFIVLFNLTNINITERIREIATIKVLGFTKKETAAYVFRENIGLTAIGAFFGLFLGKVFHKFVMSCINIEMVAFDVRIKPVSYVYSVLLTFAFAWIVNLFMQNKLDKISMTESLKSVD
jgi:putative ABC transport system permease protein